MHVNRAGVGFGAEADVDNVQKQTIGIGWPLSQEVFRLLLAYLVLLGDCRPMKDWPGKFLLNDDSFAQLPFHGSVV